MMIGQARLAAWRSPSVARAQAWPASTVLRSALWIVALALAYYVAGRSSLALQYEGPVAALWLPVGVGAAALYLGGLRWWPGILIGDLALLDPAQPIAVALVITAGNLADILLIAVLLRRLLGPRGVPDRLPEVGGLLAAIGAGALTTALVASAAVLAGGVVEPPELGAFWRSWLLADAAGSLVVIPLVLAWTQPAPRPWGPRVTREGPLAIGAVLALTAVALTADPPLMYLVFPALIWAALRLGQRGATLAVAATAGLTVAVTATEPGAFMERSITDRALSTQLYIAVAALTTLCVAAIVSERRRAAKELAASRARIAAAGAEERRRLERELHDSVQNRLVAIQVRLGMLRDRVEATDPEGAASLDFLVAEADDLGAQLRRIGHGISPPLLATHGVVAALRAECEHSTIPVTIEAGKVGLSAPEVETAVYLCCLEAIQNAAKHGGPGTSVTVTIWPRAGELVFRVQDTGRGFDIADALGSAGLTGLKDRMGGAAGHIWIDTAPGRGVTVTGVVPWPARLT